VNVFLLGDRPAEFNGPVRALAAETGCRYLSELSYPDRVTVGLRVGRIGTSSVRYELAVFRNDAEEASAEGHFVHVYVDGRTHRPVPIPAAERDRLRRIAVPGAEA
jgi:acyl-CoA thioester hydrolase